MKKIYPAGEFSVEQRKVIRIPEKIKHLGFIYHYREGAFTMRIAKAKAKKLCERGYAVRLVKQKYLPGALLYVWKR